MHYLPRLGAAFSGPPCSRDEPEPGSPLGGRRRRPHGTFRNHALGAGFLRAVLHCNRPLPNPRNYPVNRPTLTPRKGDGAAARSIAAKHRRSVANFMLSLEQRIARERELALMEGIKPSAREAATAWADVLESDLRYLRGLHSSDPAMSGVGDAE